MNFYIARNPRAPLPAIFKAPSSEVTPVIQGMSARRPFFMEIRGSSVRKAPGWSGSITGLNGIIGQ